MVAANKGHGAFFPSCVYHCNRWGSIQIGADTSVSAFAAWYNADFEGAADASKQDLLWNRGFWNQGMSPGTQSQDTSSYPGTQQLG